MKTHLSQSLDFYRQRFQSGSEALQIAAAIPTNRAEENSIYQPHWFCHEAVHDTESKCIALTGGVGSGKSDAGVIWHWTRCRQNHRSPISWVVTRTHAKIWDSIFPRYERQLQQFGYHRRIHYDYRKKPTVLTYLYSGHEVHFHGADRPDLFEATEISHCLIEEPGRMKAGVFTEIMERLRCTKAKYRQIMFTGVPQGLSNWYADEFNF